VSIDRRLMKIAIKQIIDNAFKYSPSDSPVSLHVFRTGDRVAVEVRDEGRGSPEEEQSRVFNRFYRSPSVRENIPGSGLGLSIAHRILQAHGGEVTVTSRPGRTVFRLSLPIPREST
jgi:signal transduction histidine kinase